MGSGRTAALKRWVLWATAFIAGVVLLFFFSPPISFKFRWEIAGIATPILIWELFWFAVTIACAVAGFLLAQMLKRRSKTPSAHL